MDETTWWNLLENNWDQIIKLIEDYYPNPKRLDLDGLTITAPLAESACKTIRTSIQPISNIKEFTNLYRMHRDTDKMLSLLNNTWFAMPENYNIRKLPGFMILCELCEGVVE